MCYVVYSANGQCMLLISALRGQLSHPKLSHMIIVVRLFPRLVLSQSTLPLY